MFEGLAKTVSEEMLSLSSGQLQCLPYSRALLDVFKEGIQRRNCEIGSLEMQYIS